MDSEIGLPGKGARKSGASAQSARQKMAVGNCPHLPTDTRGKARVDDRRVISGIVHVLKSGGRWIDAPPEYGPKKTLYNRYVVSVFPAPFTRQA